MGYFWKNIQEGNILLRNLISHLFELQRPLTACKETEENQQFFKKNWEHTDRQKEGVRLKDRQTDWKTSRETKRQAFGQWILLFIYLFVKNWLCAIRCFVLCTKVRYVQTVFSKRYYSAAKLTENEDFENNERRTSKM